MHRKILTDMLAACRRFLQPRLEAARSSSHGLRKLEMGVPADASMFHHVPRPECHCHVIQDFLGRRSMQSVAGGASPEQVELQQIFPAVKDPAFALIVSPLQSLQPLQMVPSIAEEPSSPPAPSLGHSASATTPFADDDELAELPTLRAERTRHIHFRSAKSQPLPSLDKLLPQNVDVQLERQDQTLPAVHLKRHSTASQSLSRRSTTHNLQRIPSSQGRAARGSDGYAPSSALHLWQDPVALQTQCRVGSLQRWASFNRSSSYGSMPAFDPAGHLQHTRGRQPKRTTSQPTIDEEGKGLDIRRSVSSSALLSGNGEPSLPLQQRSASPLFGLCISCAWKAADC
jgi:hypothetical protein